MIRGAGSTQRGPARSVEAAPARCLLILLAIVLPLSCSKGDRAPNDSESRFPAQTLRFAGDPAPRASARARVDVLGDDEMEIVCEARHQYVDLAVDIDAGQYNVIEVAMTNRGGGSHHSPRLAWRGADQSFSEARDVRFPPRNPGSTKPYLLHVEENAGWSGRITELRLFPSDLPCHVKIESIRLRQLPLAWILGGGEYEATIERFTIGPETRDVSFVPVGATHRQSFDVGADRLLRFGVGVPDHVRRRMTDAVEFEVRAAGGDLIDRVVLEPLATGATGNQWVDRAVVVPGAGSRVELVFATVGGRGSEPDAVGLTGTASEVAAFFAHPGFSASVPTGRPKNILLICLDTLRADHLGGYGYPRSTSPWLDRLARDSVQFVSATAQGAKTLPSHMSLFTGLLPSVHQIIDETDQLSVGWPMWVDDVRSMGYHSAAFTEDAFVSAVFGFSYGFDRYHDGTFHLLAGGEDLDRGGDVRTTFGRGVDFLKAGATSPWLLFMHTYEPHSPYCPESEYRGMFADPSYSGPVSSCVQDRFLKEIHGRQQRSEFGEVDLAQVVGRYDEEIRFTDAEVSMFLAELEGSGEWDDTLTVLFSDHGEDFGDHRDIGRHGHQVYESVVHVPLLVRWPNGGIEPRVIDTPVMLMDVGPTVLELLGETPSDLIQGRSLVPLLRGDQWPGPDAVFAENRSVYQRIAVRDGDWKMILNLGWNREKVDPERVSPGHRVAFGSTDPVELYNLAEDPAERNNIAAAQSQVVARLRDRIGALTESSQRIREQGPDKGTASPGGNIDKMLAELGYKESVDDETGDDKTGDDTKGDGGGLPDGETEEDE